MMGIYTITNLVTGKVYVGSSSNVPARRSDHFSRLRSLRHPNGRLQGAWSKYGKGAFIFEIVEIVEDAFWLIPREQAWIDRLSSWHRDYGYNIRKFAESNAGLPMSPSNRDRLVGQVQSQVTRDRRSASLKAAHAEGRHPGGAALRGIPRTEEWKEKVRGPRDLSDESRKRMSDAAKVLQGSPEARSARKDSADARWASPETREKIIAAMNTPEAVKRRSDAMRERWARPETRKKMSDARNSPDYVKKLAATLSSPESRKRRSDAATAREAAKRLNGPRDISPESRKKMSDAAKEQWAKKREAKNAV